jgi:hypothetical protein
MASSKLAITGSKSFVKVWKFETSFKAMLINVSFSEKTLSSLPMWMIASFSGKNMADIDSVISSLHKGTENFQLVDQGSIDKYLGLLIQDIDATSFELSQPFLTRWILSLLSLDEHKTKGRETPVGKPLLNRDLGGVPCKHTLLY